jgi:hypothetical protein
VAGRSFFGAYSIQLTFETHLLSTAFCVRGERLGVNVKTAIAVAAVVINSTYLSTALYFLQQPDCF